MAGDTGYPKAAGVDGVFVSFLSQNKLSACVLIDFLLNSALLKKKNKKTALAVWSPLKHFNELPSQSLVLFGVESPPSLVSLTSRSARGWSC